MNMNSILITGCNRGIGYGLVKHLSENYEIRNIFATCRDLERARVSCYFIIHFSTALNDKDTRKNLSAHRWVFFVKIVEKRSINVSPAKNEQK